MRALTFLYGGSLVSQAFEPVLNGISAFSLALKQAAAFPGSEKTILLAGEGEVPELSASCMAEQQVSLIQRPAWTVSELLKTLSEESAGFDFAYYAWADSPFLDPVLAGKIAERHTRFASEYSYADGWPGGMAPELINSSTAGILYKIAGEDGTGPVRRNSLFSVLQKDINSFDIETEISAVDLRHHRLLFSADSKRKLLLLERFDRFFLPGETAGYAGNIAGVIADHPEYLRTLPAFFPIQVSGSCPQNSVGSCSLCPYPQFGAKGGSVYERNDFLDLPDFIKLLDKIQQFAGDGVIDLSLWGEFSLHPRREDFIQAVLDRPALSLLIETSGYGWTGLEIEKIAGQAAAAKPRFNGLPAVSWIVSLGPGDIPLGEPAGGPGHLQAVRETEAVSFVKKLVSVFPREAEKNSRVFVEAVRTAGAEDAIEKFYRAWKAAVFSASGNGALDGIGPEVIIQKYDSFCGFLPQKQAVDLSPVERRPCWHLMRDFPVYIDGTVPLCREDLSAECTILGNAFHEDLETIWKQGEQSYLLHCRKEYAPGSCRICDEYYTFNF